MQWGEAPVFASECRHSHACTIRTMKTPRPLSKLLPAPTRLCMAAAMLFAATTLDAAEQRFVLEEATIADI